MVLSNFFRKLRITPPRRKYLSKYMYLRIRAQTSRPARRSCSESFTCWRFQFVQTRRVCPSALSHVITVYSPFTTWPSSQPSVPLRCRRPAWPWSSARVIEVWNSSVAASAASVANVNFLFSFRGCVFSLCLFLCLFDYCERPGCRRNSHPVMPTFLCRVFRLHFFHGVDLRPRRRAP